MRPPEARAQPEVRQLNVTVAVDEDVIRLYVPVNEAHFMNRLDGENQLGDVKARHVFAEYTEFDQQAHEVPARHVLHNEIQVVLVLERVEKLHDPFVVRLRENVAFGFDVCDLVSFQHFGFFQDFHGVERTRLNMFRQTNLAKGTHTDHAQPLEHARIHFGSLQADVVRFLLVQNFAHLGLRFGRKLHLAHLILELDAPLFPLLAGLLHILYALLHVELIRLRRKPLTFALISFGARGRSFFVDRSVRLAVHVQRGPVFDVHDQGTRLIGVHGGLALLLPPCPLLLVVLRRHRSVVELGEVFFLDR